jgi:hypothetical protein
VALRSKHKSKELLFLALLALPTSLTLCRVFYMVSNMSKKVTAREFLHNFARLEKQLRPGESITVTRRGEAIGAFTKKLQNPRVPLPDFEKDASRPGFTAADGDALLARMLKDEELS